MPNPLTLWITIHCGKFWKMRIPDHLTCLLRNLYASQEAIVRTGQGTIDLFQKGNGVRQGSILSPCLFNLHAEYIMRNAGLEEVQAGIKIAGRNINNLRYADDYNRKWRRNKEPLDESERGEWKSWLKTQHSENKDHGIWSHRFMANRWGNSGNIADFIFLGSKIMADGDCSHKIKRHLLLGGKVMTNIHSILKSRDITLPTKVRLVKAMVFHVWAWELDYKGGWAPKNWCFWTVVLEKTLESPLYCKGDPTSSS